MKYVNMTMEMNNSLKHIDNNKTAEEGNKVDEMKLVVSDVGKISSYNSDSTYNRDLRVRHKNFFAPFCAILCLLDIW